MEYSQVARHRFLTPTFKGSNPFTPISSLFQKIVDCVPCSLYERVWYVFRLRRIVPPFGSPCSLRELGLFDPFVVRYVGFANSNGRTFERKFAKRTESTMNRANNEESKRLKVEHLKIYYFFFNIIVKRLKQKYINAVD